MTWTWWQTFEAWYLCGIYFVFGYDVGRSRRR